MSANDEIRTYLDFLLDHERGCTRPACPVCESAERIYETVRSRIFSAAVYPEAGIRQRRALDSPSSTACELSTKKAA